LVFFHFLAWLHIDVRWTSLYVYMFMYSYATKFMWNSLRKAGQFMIETKIKMKIHLSFHLFSFLSYWQVPACLLTVASESPHEGWWLELPVRLVLHSTRCVGALYDTNVSVRKSTRKQQKWKVKNKHENQNSTNWCSFFFCFVFSFFDGCSIFYVSTYLTQPTESRFVGWCFFEPHRLCAMCVLMRGALESRLELVFLHVGASCC
jgi:hypothetical protein